MIQQRITQYIEKNHLFSSDSKILVALSGGADSVALLRILHTAGYHCEAAHCNFHLRGEESNRDESFVRQLCLKYNIRLHTADFNTTQYAAEKHISIEMAARELRYNWFEEIKNKYRADVIAVAHHQDDSIETMLLNLSVAQESPDYSESVLETELLYVHSFVSTAKRSFNIYKTLNRIM